MLKDKASTSKLKNLGLSSITVQDKLVGIYGDGGFLVAWRECTTAASAIAFSKKALELLNECSDRLGSRLAIEFLVENGLDMNLNTTSNFSTMSVGSYSWDSSDPRSKSIKTMVPKYFCEENTKESIRESFKKWNYVPKELPKYIQEFDESLL